MTGGCADSQFLFRNTLTEKRYFDPTVDEHHYKSLPQIQHRIKSNFLIYPRIADELHKPRPIANSISYSLGYYLEPPGSFHPNLSQQKHQSDIQKSTTKYTFQETSHSPYHQSSGHSYTFKFKNPENDSKKSGNLDHNSKLLKSGYIPLSVSCKYNTTTCKSAHDGSSTKYNSRKSLKLNSSFSEKYNQKMSSILIPKDFVPIFDDDDGGVLNKNTFLPYLQKNIEPSTKSTGLKYETPNGYQHFRKNIYKIPEHTLFRHSFDFKAPSIPKYINI